MFIFLHKETEDQRSEVILPGTFPFHTSLPKHTKKSVLLILISSVVFICECLLTLFQIQILDIILFLCVDPSTILWLFLGLFPLSVTFSCIKNHIQSLFDGLLYFLFKCSLEKSWLCDQP